MKRTKTNKVSILATPLQPVEEPRVVNINMAVLEEAFGEDTDQLLFFVTWLKCGLNASKAYLELHPDVDPHSARTLGARALAKVDRSILLSVYGLGVEKYMEQLRDGLNAEKENPYSGQITPDHFVRRFYHDKLGKMLGIEDEPKSPQIGVAVQVVMPSWYQQTKDGEDK